MQGQNYKHQPAVGSLGEFQAVYVRTRRTVWFLFFLFKQKTAYEVSTDWSSDVCSSDLRLGPEVELRDVPHSPDGGVIADYRSEIGRASCRERVYTSCVAVALEKKNG